MAKADHLEGGCACGALRYRLTDVPILVNNCHCRLCQRQTGAASAVNAFIEADRYEHLSGATREHPVATGSGTVQTIVRCALCGTPVWSHYPTVGRLAVAIRVGTLDDPGAVTPDAAIYVADRPRWAPLPAGVPAFEADYDPAQLLPPDRLARGQALLARVVLKESVDDRPHPPAEGEPRRAVRALRGALGAQDRRALQRQRGPAGEDRRRMGLAQA